MAVKFNYPTWSALSLDRNDAKPLHVQIFDQLRDAILTGRILKGQRLPPTRLLADELQVSRNTIVLVYERLAAEGYSSSRIGAGTYVASVLPEERRPARTQDMNRIGAADAMGKVSHRARTLSTLALPSERIGALDLSPTVPALDELPFDQFAKVSAGYWRSEPTADLMGYGFPLGLPALRDQIASYLGEAHGIACTRDQILVVSGTTQGFILASHVLADPGDKVIVEDPAYGTRMAALMAAGLELVHVPIDQQGLNSETFRDITGVKMIVVSPTNQFPFGSTMPMTRRRALLQWAEENEAWILEYDFNNAFHFRGQPMPAIAAMDRAERVIYIGNFNRSISPALNLAYIVMPSELIEAFTRANHIFSFDAPSPIQGVVADFMKTGQLAAHIRRMGGRYRERAGLMVHCLKTLLGDTFEVSDTGAGLHLSAIARGQIDDAAISHALLDLGIDVPAMSRYCMGERIVHGFVFGFGNTPAERIGPALKVFSEVLAAHRP